MVHQTNEEILSYYSGKLIKLAWVIECAVVAVGLAISVLMASQHSQDLSIPGMIVAAGPFIIVAIAELTKIPLALTIFFYSWRKPFYILLAILVCTITFETLFNGFERNFASLNTSIERIKIQVHRKHDKIETNKARIEKLKAEMVAEMADIDKRAAAKQKALQNRIRAIHARAKLNNSDLKSVKAYIAQITKELQTLRTQRAAKSKEWLEEKSKLMEAQRKQSSGAAGSAAEERKALRARLADLNARMDKELADASFLTEGSIRKRYDAKIKQIETNLQELNRMSLAGATGDVAKQRLENSKQQADMLNGQFSMIIEDLNQRIAEYKSELKSAKANAARLKKAQRQGVATRIKNARASTNSQMQDLKSEKDKVKEEFATTKEKIDSIEEQNFQLKDEIDSHNLDIEDLTLSNQVYRIAAYFDNAERANQIKKQTVGLVATVWFASLAFICSITGISMASASLHLRALSLKLKDEREEEEELDAIVEQQMQAAATKKQEALINAQKQEA